MAWRLGAKLECPRAVGKVLHMVFLARPTGPSNNVELLTIQFMTPLDLVMCAVFM